MKVKKSKKGKRTEETTGKKSKKQRLAERAEKKAARKGDGSFPDVLVVTKEKSSHDGGAYFLGHGEDLASIYKDGQVAAVYKLRRVSTVTINRKVAR
jgi:hypothetical protein